MVPTNCTTVWIARDPVRPTIEAGRVARLILKSMQSTRKSAVRFRERSELLDFLLEVTSATSNTLDLDELLSNVAGIVKKVISYDLFAILLYSERRQDLRIRYAVGHREEVVRSLSIRLGEGITGAAAAQREPILVADVRTDPPLPQRARRRAQRAGRPHAGAQPAGGHHRRAVHRASAPTPNTTARCCA